MLILARDAVSASVEQLTRLVSVSQHLLGKKLMIDEHKSTK
jgi:hypothetical protein